MNVLDFKWRQLHLSITDEMLFRIMRHLRREYKPFLSAIKEDLCSQFKIDFSPYKEKGIFSTPLFRKMSVMDRIHEGDIFLGSKMEQYYVQVRKDRKCLDVIAMNRGAGDDKEFNQFCEIITQAIFPMVKSEHHLAWKEYHPKSEKYRLLKNDIPVFAPAQEDYRAVVDLESVKSRELLNKIKMKPSVSLSELADENEKLMVGALVQKMEQLGLVNIDYIVFCHQTGHQINRVNSISSIEEAAQQGFKCFHCGRLVSQEKIDQCISITPYGHYITRGSYWLAVRLLGILKGAGLWGEDILIDCPEDGVDIINLYFNCDSSLVMVEIKGDLFTMYDAYLFYNKICIYKPDNVILITTQSVKQGIKDYFKEVLPDLNIICIDNITELPQKLAAFLEQKRIEYVLELLKNFKSCTYVDMSPLAIAGFFGLEAEKTEEEEEIEEIIKIKPEEEDLIEKELEDLIPEDLSPEEPEDLIPEALIKEDLIKIEEKKPAEVISSRVKEEISLDVEDFSDLADVNMLLDESSSKDEEILKFDSSDIMDTDMMDLDTDIMDTDIMSDMSDTDTDFSFDDAMNFLDEGFSLDDISIEEGTSDISVSDTSADMIRSLTAQEVIDNIDRDGVIGKSVSDIQSSIKPLGELEGINGITLASSEGFIITTTLNDTERAEVIAATSVELDRRLSRAIKAMGISRPVSMVVEAMEGKILLNMSKDFVLSSLIDDKPEYDENKVEKKLNDLMKRFDRENETSEQMMTEFLKSLQENASIVNGLIGSDEGLLISSSLSNNFSSENWIAYLTCIYQVAEDTALRLHLGNIDRYMFKSQVNNKDLNIICSKNGPVMLCTLVQDEEISQDLSTDLNAAGRVVNLLLGI